MFAEWEIGIAAAFVCQMFRLALGKSQERLADDCGLHWSYVSQVERGRRNLSLHNILRLAEGLSVDPGELVAGIKAPASDTA